MSSVTKAMDYVPTPVQRTSRSGIMVISEMSSFRIIGYLAYRHRVGLLMTSTTLLLAYIAYDKFLHIFF